MTPEQILAEKLREAADEIEHPHTAVARCQDCGGLTDCVWDRRREAYYCDDWEHCQAVQEAGLGLSRSGSAALEVMQSVQAPEVIELERWSKPEAPGALCYLCPLASRPVVPTYVPEGYDGTLMVGEAPGGVEVARGQPFIGPTGRLLEETYRKVGGSWETVAKTNAVLCRPPTDREPGRPTTQELQCCAPRLKAEIERLAPKKTLALGRVAVEQLTDVGGVALREAGWNGTVLTTVHPAFVLRRGDAFPAFKRALERFRQGPQASDADLQEEPEVTVIESSAQLRQVFESIEDGAWVSFDIETDQTNWYTRMFTNAEVENEPNHRPADAILCLVFTTGLNYGWVIPDWLIYDVPGAKDLISAFFARVRKIAHNSKFDAIFLRSVGIDVGDIDVDTILLHYCLDEIKGTHGLKLLAQEELGLPDYEAQLIKPYLRSERDKYSKIPEHYLYKYAVWDVCTTLALAARFKRRAIREKQWEMPFLGYRMPNNRTLINIEYRGVKVDIPYLLEWRDLLAKRAEFIRKKIAGYAGDPDFNPGSVKQMQKLLFHTVEWVDENGRTRKGLPLTEGIRSREGGNSGAIASKKGSTSIQALTPLRGMHPAVDLIREYRTCKKMRKAYIIALLNAADTNGRVHTTYSQYGTVTGRLSSYEVALQNIPRGGSFYGQIIKAAFIAEQGNAWIDTDYAQAQLRIFAALTNDPFIINVYANDLDLHEEVMIAQYGAKETLTDREKKQYRYYCKVFNFGWAFGGGAEMLAELMPDRQMALEFVARYEKNMAVAAQWRRDQVARAARYGFVESRLGVRRRGYLGSLGGPEAINAPVQAGEAEVVLRSARRLDDMGYDLLMLVHDSINGEIEERRGEELRSAMQQVMVEEAEKLFPEVVWKADADPLYDKKTGELRTRWANKPSEEEVETWLQSMETDEEAAEDGIFGDVAAKRGV